MRCRRPITVLRAPRKHAAGRGPRPTSPSTRAGGVGAVVLALVLAVMAGTAGAAGGRASQAAPAIEIVSPPRIVMDDEAFSLDVRVDGAPDGSALELIVHDGVSSRGEFQQTLDGDLGGIVRDLSPQPVAEVTGDGPDHTASLGFVPGEQGLRRNVYPVEVQLRGASGEVLDSVVTYLAYIPADTPAEFEALKVAVVVDIAAPPALRPDGRTSLSPTAIDEAVQRVAAVEAAGDAEVTLAPRPETLQALALDEGAGGDAVDRLRRLARRHRVLARPFVEVDYGALQAAGLISEANQQAEAGADVVRDRLGVEPLGGTWLSGATWGETSAQLAERLGIGRAVVPPSAVVDGESASLHYNPLDLGASGVTAMIEDPELAARLTSDDGMIAAHRFLAELAITWLEAPSNPRAVVVRLPPDGDIDAEVVGAGLAGLAGERALKAVPVPQVFDRPASSDGPTALPLAPDPAGPDLTGIADDLRSARRQIDGVGSFLADPGASADLGHSLLLATGTATRDDERSRYVEHATDAISAVDGAVTLPAQFRITLTARSSTIPVRLTNNLDDEVTVRIELESDQLEFPDGAVIDDVALAPGATSLDVPVRARTSGAFTMDVAVTSPDGSLVLDRSTFDVRSTAISGVGLVLSVGAGLFLVVWWARNWRRSRRTDGPRGDAERVPPDTELVGDAGGGDDDRTGGSPAPPADDRVARRASTAKLAPWAAPDRPAPSRSPGAAWPAGPEAGRADPPPTSRSAIDLRRSGAPTPPPDVGQADAGDDATYRPAHMAPSGRRRSVGLPRSATTRARRR